jgi:hypothetical protein
MASNGRPNGYSGIGVVEFMVRGNVPELGALSPSPEKDHVTVAEPAAVPVTVTEQLEPDRVQLADEKLTLPASLHEIVSPSTVDAPKAAPETVAVQVVIEPTSSVDTKQLTDVVGVAGFTVKSTQRGMSSSPAPALYEPAC